MIVFKVGSALYEFDGILSVQTQEKYKFEKKSPFDPALNYRFGDITRIVLIFQS